jgi:hypothetical protein
MPLTLDKILQCEERLQAEIAERECLLAAVKVMRSYAEKGKSLKALEVGALGQALLAPAAANTLTVVSVAQEPAKPAPALPQPKRYIHPDLEKLRLGHGGDTAVVNWAIGGMTADFTLHDVSKLLKREGCPMRNPRISVVLTRFQRHGRIHVIERGRGPIPQRFRQPDRGTPADAVNADTICGNEEPAVAATA